MLVWTEVRALPPHGLTFILPFSVHTAQPILVLLSERTLACKFLFLIILSLAHCNVLSGIQKIALMDSKGS